MNKCISALIGIWIFTGCVWGQSGVKYILLEEFSTTPCGFCPDGDVIAAQLIKDHPNVIWMTHHAGFGTDSLTVPESIPIANTFTTFAPGACLDRGDYPIPVYTMPPYIAVSRQKWDSVCVAHLNDPPVADVKITNVYNTLSRLLNCTVEVSFMTTPSSGDLRLNLYVVEDSIVGFGKGFDQTNYFNTTPGHPCYQKGDPIVGYVHHRVLRSVPTGAWGLSGIIPASPEAGKTYSYTSTNLPISPNWKEKDIDVIAFVSYYNTEPKQRQVINSNHKMLTDASGTGVKSDMEKTPHLSLFPHPANRQISFQYNPSGISADRLIISDYFGRTLISYVLDTGTNGVSFSVEEFPAGIYFYRLMSGVHKLQTGKFLVMH